MPFSEFSNVQFDQDLMFTIALVATGFLLMKYMPRLLALGVKFVDGGVLKAKLDDGEDVVVIDVRTAGEYGGDSGHVPGAINLPLGDLRSRLDSIQSDLAPFKSHPVYLMCRTENRSSSAARVLKKAGFENLSVVKGGIVGWGRAGYPVEK